MTNDDDVRLRKSTEDLRAAIIEKMGNIDRPVSVGELAHVYVHMLLVNEAVSELFDLGAADEIEDQIKAMRALRPVLIALRDNFHEVVRKTVSRQALLKPTATNGSEDES